MSTKTRKVPNKTEPTELFMTLQDPQKVLIREKLLQCMQTETIGHVRNKIGDAVAEIARQYSDDGQYQYVSLSALTLKQHLVQDSRGVTYSAHCFRRANLPTMLSEREPFGYLRPRLELSKSRTRRQFRAHSSRVSRITASVFVQQ